MTEPNSDPADYKDPADRRPVQYDEIVAAVTDPSGADLEPPSYATTDVDPLPGSPRSFVASEPNFATTDVDPLPGSPRSFVASEPNFATTDIDPISGTARTDVVPHPTGGAAVRPAEYSVGQHTTTPAVGRTGGPPSELFRPEESDRTIGRLG